MIYYFYISSCTTKQPAQVITSCDIVTYCSIHSKCVDDELSFASEPGRKEENEREEDQTSPFMTELQSCSSSDEEVPTDKSE